LLVGCRRDGRRGALMPPHLLLPVELHAAPPPQRAPLLRLLPPQLGLLRLPLGVDLDLHRRDAGRRRQAVKGRASRWELAQAGSAPQQHRAPLPKCG
jgi:hypothetical protein